MKIGIAGFAGSGKTTVFQWLTGVKPDPAAAQRGQVGIAKMQSGRASEANTKMLTTTFAGQKIHCSQLRPRSTR